MPWWAGVLLAVATFIVLHLYAATSVSLEAVKGVPTGSSLVRMMTVSLARVGQYAIPVICLAGAALSAWARRERTRLIDQVADSDAADVLEHVSWREFEMLVGEAYRLRGYMVAETGAGGPDGGVDLVLSKDGERTIVQCKQWKARSVGVTVVRELFGVMAASGSSAGIVVTSGRFTEATQTFAKGRRLHLVEGSALRTLIKSAKASKNGGLDARDRVDPVRPHAPGKATDWPTTAPSAGATSGACGRQNFEEVGTTTSSGSIGTVITLPCSSCKVTVEPAATTSSSTSMYGRSAPEPSIGTTYAATASTDSTSCLYMR